MIRLGRNRYGKSAVRLVKVVREGELHRVRDLTVAVALEGDFDVAHTVGDNSRVIATDTMKNTVYALAPQHLSGSIEAFGLALADHFAREPQVRRAVVSIQEHAWQRIMLDGREAPDAFRRIGGGTRTAEVAVGEGERVESGVEDLVVMKTANSRFRGFPRDEYTTLGETDDRILATRISAAWRYREGSTVDHDAAWSQALETLLAVFAEHRSESVQQSIWLMGRAMLDRHPELDEVRMRLPNLHHWPVDLSPFGLANANEIFVATSEPYGLIEATVTRTDSPDSEAETGTGEAPPRIA